MTILEKGRRDNSALMRSIEALPLDKRWEVIVRPYRAKRSDQQNAYWWGVVVKLLAESVGYETEEVHEYLCGTHFGWKDKRSPKTPRNPDGVESAPVRTTTKDALGNLDTLNKQDFGDLIAFAQRFGAERGVLIPDPDPEWFMREDAA